MTGAAWGGAQPLRHGWNDRVFTALDIHLDEVDVTDGVLREKVRERQRLHGPMGFLPGEQQARGGVAAFAAAAEAHFARARRDAEVRKLHVVAERAVQLDVALELPVGERIGLQAVGAARDLAAIEQRGTDPAADIQIGMFGTQEALEDVECGRLPATLGDVVPEVRMPGRVDAQGSPAQRQLHTRCRLRGGGHQGTPPAPPACSVVPAGRRRLAMATEPKNSDASTAIPASMNSMAAGPK